MERRSLISHLPQNIQDKLIEELAELGKEYDRVHRSIPINENKYPYTYNYLFNKDNKKDDNNIFINQKEENR